MAENTYKIPTSTTSGSRGEGLFSFLNRWFGLDGGTAEVIHVRFLPQILFISAICIVYIGNRNYAEKKIRKINALETEVSDLRADYTTLKARYKFSSKQSEVAKQARRLGLYESKVPPYKVSAD